MARVRIEFDGPLLFSHELAVRISDLNYGNHLGHDSLGELGARGCDLLYRVTDRETGALVAMAKTGIVFYDHQERRLVAMPPRFRALLPSRSTQEGQAR